MSDWIDARYLAVFSQVQYQDTLVQELRIHEHESAMAFMAGG